MESIFESIRQDIEAAIEAFNQEDFENMNIFGNRIMANAIFGIDGKLALPGFFLKDVALTYGILKAQRVSAFATAKSIAISYLNSLRKLTQNRDFDEDKLWREFHEYDNKIAKLEKNEFEEKVYKDNPDFTHYATVWLIKLLNEKKEILLNPNNQFLGGILNEISRLFKVHGRTLTDTYAASLITALTRYYDYFRLAYQKADGNIDENKVKEIIFPYVDKIMKLLTYSAQVKASDVDTVLWELIKGWRESFIYYLEKPRPGYAIEKGIELPEETKKKLSESITKALEREVETKK